MQRPFALIRAQSGISLDRAAIRIGISPGYLRQLERGTAALSFRVAGKMAAAYGCRLSDLTHLPVEPAEGGGPAVEWKRRPGQRRRQP